MTVIRYLDWIRCRFSAPTDSVIKCACWDIVFITPVSICHAALVVCSTMGTRAMRVPVITYPP